MAGQTHRLPDRYLQTIRAPAKINLFLTVKSRKPDGYHEIETVFVPLARMADTIAIAPLDRTGIELTCSDPRVPLDHRNLCFRAASLLAETGGLEPAWKIAIDKRIPVAAGLGGGSSDAAATLVLLNRLAGAGLSPECLHGMACRLGADVAFFLRPAPALGTGIGDRLTRLELGKRLSLAILNPGGFPLSAAWAYATVREPFDNLSANLLAAAMRDRDLASIAERTYNCFEQAVRWKLPLVAMFLDFLSSHHCLAARVSGSGPTVYGICRDQDHAATVVRLARQAFGRSVKAWHDQVAATS